MASSQKLRRMQKKIVVIYGSDDVKYGSGHGALISRDGLILTAFHLIDGESIGSEIFVKCDCGDGTKKMKAKVIKFEKKLDLAILQINATNCEYARVAPEVHTGQDVDIMVSRDGDSFSYTRGTVAFERRPRAGISQSKEIEFIDENTSLVQVHGLHGVPGYSGSPVFDSRCRMVGIYTSGYMRMDFLVHREHFKTFFQPFIQEGQEEEEEVEAEEEEAEVGEGEAEEEEAEAEEAEAEEEEVVEEEVEVEKKKKKKKREEGEEGKELKKKKREEEDEEETKKSKRKKRNQTSRHS